MFDWEASGLACNTQAATTPIDNARRPIIPIHARGRGSINPPERPLSMFDLKLPQVLFTSDRSNCP